MMRLPFIKSTMRRRFRSILFSSFIGAAPAMALDYDSLAFPESRTRVVEEIGKPRLGFSIGVGSYGAHYERPLTPRRTFVLSFLYDPLVFTFNPKVQQVDNLLIRDVDIKNRTSIMAGLDQLLIGFGKNKRDWGVVGGFRSGVSQTFYDVAYYRGKCEGGFCIYDTRALDNPNFSALTAFVDGRLGIRVFDTRVSTIKSDITIAIQSELARYPNPQVSRPDGEYETFPREVNSTLVFEASSAF